MSWEAAEEKKEEAAMDENEGYWLSMQVRNNKKTAILALMDETSRKGKNVKKDGKLFFVYRWVLVFWNRFRA